MIRLFLFVGLVLSLTSCTYITNITPQSESTQPNVANSDNTLSVETANDLKPPFGDTVGTVFDIIQESDSSLFACIEYLGRGERQVWDKRVDDEPTIDAFLFRARYQDGADIEIIINPEFGSAEAAQEEAEVYTKPLGQLPSSLREGIETFSVHKGDESPHAGTGVITLYADTTRQRQSYDHLEETLFHEAVHASWDERYEQSEEWLTAQENDGRFLTQYGLDAEAGEGEDLAETALFAYAVSHFPGRIPPADTEDILGTVPNRIKFIEILLTPDKSIFYEATGEVTCK